MAINSDQPTSPTLQSDTAPPQNLMFKDEDVLNEKFREMVLQEIRGRENIERKKRALRRWECYRDMTTEHVMLRLRDQGFKVETIKQMRARASNISIVKKINKKKARAYAAGVDREMLDAKGVKDENATKDLQKLAEFLKLTQIMRKGDEYRELFRNALVYIHPIAEEVIDTADGAKNMWSMTHRVFGAHQYDAIPDGQNRERARCIVLSEFPAGLNAMSHDLGSLGYRDSAESSAKGDGVDQTIANNPEDAGGLTMQGKRRGSRFIWWTAKYHLTTDDRGKIIDNLTPPINDGEAGPANPIKRLPFADLSKDQDGAYWAQGGDDILEGAIFINMLITDCANILSAQGYGQPVLTTNKKTGTNDEIVTGPHNLIILRQEAGEPPPSFKLESTDPHTMAWLQLAEVYIAMLLTTNNLSPKNISGKLDVSSAASGIAKMIDESESTEDITETQGYFAHKEQHIWAIVNAWLDVLRPTDRLVDELKAVKQFDGRLVNAKFRQQGVVLSEMDKLDIMKKKKDMGLTPIIDLLKLDQPDLTDEEATAKLARIIAERLRIQQEDPTLLAQTTGTRITETVADPNAPAMEIGGKPGQQPPGKAPPAAPGKKPAPGAQPAPKNAGKPQ